MRKSSITDILKGIIPWTLRIEILIVWCKKQVLLMKFGLFQGLTNREGFADYNIDACLFDGISKKQGISGIARLRNAEDFLEIAIRSHLPYFDEIILADNMSTDSTRTICNKLYQEYPDKIKIYQYPFVTHKLGSEEYKMSSSDSVYDLSYFYNWVLSKVSYKRVAKVDDDHIIIPDIMQSNRDLILSDLGYHTYYHMLGVNVIKANGEYQLPTNGPFMGIYGDHGFFPVSRTTYYIHDSRSENFIHRYNIRFLPITFVHLKYLKDYTKNYQGVYNTFNDTISQGGFISLPDVYGDYLKMQEVGGVDAIF